MQPSDIVNAARKHLGTPFKHQGRLPGIALDCAGLLVVVCRDLGITVKDFQGYGRNPYNGLLEESMSCQCSITHVPVKDMREGDFMLMRFSGAPQHLAICAGETMIHAYENSGKVVEHRIADIWRARIVRVYRVVDIA